MTTNQSAQIIRDYLDQVSSELSDLSAAERVEILGDISAHISEAIGDIETASEADVRNVIDRLGRADEVAREARGRETAATGPENRPTATDEVEMQTIERGTPGALEVAAIILTAIFWPIGILLAWLSSRWLTRDKVIATIIPLSASLLIGMFAVAGLMVVWSTGSSEVVTVTEEVQTAPAPGVPDLEPRSPRQISEPDSGTDGTGIGGAIAGLVFLGGFIAAPFITAIYLAARMQPIIIQVPRSRGQNHSPDGVPARGQV